MFRNFSLGILCNAYYAMPMMHFEGNFVLSNALFATFNH